MINYFQEQNDFVKKLKTFSFFSYFTKKFQPSELLQKNFFVHKNHLPLILPMQHRMALCIYAETIDKMNLINFFRLNKISYNKLRIHFMFDDTSPKLELQGASEDLRKETNILARGFQMNATLGKITKIGNEKV